MHDPTSNTPLTQARLTRLSASVALLAALGMACGGETDGTPVTLPCGGVCPPEQCMFERCMAPEPDPDPDAGTPNPDMGDADPMPCQGDGDCADGEVCDLGSGECVPDEPPACSGDEDCGEGEICLDNEGEVACVEGCREDLDCGGEQTCVDNACVGGACTPEEGCPEGQYCDDDTRECFVGCSGDEVCDPGESCLLVGLPEGLRQRCVPTPCGADEECDEGFFCDLDGDTGSCELGCRGDVDCEDEGQVCDLDLRECVAPGCARSSECEEGFFCDRLLERPACVTGCDDDRRCPDDRACDQLLRTCTCNEDDECIGEQICFLNRCVERCVVPEDCEGDLVCDVETGRCEDTCIDDQNEPNNTPEDALDIEAGAYEMRMCHTALDGFDFNDCFAIVLRFDEVLRVRAIFNSDEGDLDLRLFDPEGILIQISQTNSDLEEVAHQAEVSGTYSFCVEPQGDDAFEMDYDLDVTLEDAPLPCLEDENEAFGDNSCPAALENLQPIAIDQEAIFDGRSICEGDEDFVAVRVRIGQILQATLTRSDGIGTIDVELVDNDCETILAQSDTFGPVRDLTYNADADGTVYLRVFADNPLQTAEYSLSVRLEAGGFLCTEDFVDNIPIEPNESFDEATIVNYQRHELVAIEDLYMCAEDTDYYSVFFQTPGDFIEVTLTQNIDDVPLEVSILDRDGQTVLIANRDLLDLKRITTLPLFQTGIYFIRVSSFGQELPETGVNYDLSVQVTTEQECPEDIHEPNNSIETATLVGNGANEATMCRTVGSEKDIYRTLLSTGDRVTFSIEYDHNTIAPMDSLPAVLYGPGGVEDFRDISFRDGDTDIDSFVVFHDFTVSEIDAGMWFIEIGAGEPGQRVDYTLHIDIESPRCDENGIDEFFEPNEDCGAAFNLATNVEVEGLVCGPTGDEDFFAVDALAGEDLTVHVDYFHFDGNLDLEVYLDGDIVGTSFNDGQNFEEVVLENVEGGRYCVRVFAPNGLTQNNYSIEVDLE